MSKEMPVETQGTIDVDGVKMQEDVLAGGRRVALTGTNDSELYSPTTSSLSEVKPTDVPGGESWLITTKPSKAQPVAEQNKDTTEENS